MVSIGRMFQKAILGRSSGRIGRYAARAFLNNRKVWVKSPPKEVKK